MGPCQGGQSLTAPWHPVWPSPPSSCCTQGSNLGLCRLCMGLSSRWSWARKTIWPGRTSTVLPATPQGCLHSSCRLCLPDRPMAFAPSSPCSFPAGHRLQLPCACQASGSLQQQGVAKITPLTCPYVEGSRGQTLREVVFCPQAAQCRDMDNVLLSWLQVPVEEEGRVGRGKLGRLGGPAGPAPACCPTHRKVYLATLLFSSTVRSARCPGWRMETRTLLTVECFSRWRAHCTVMALAVTFVISKPSTGRGPGRSKRRGLWSAAAHCGSPNVFPTSLQGGSCLPLWVDFPVGAAQLDCCFRILTTCRQADASICLPARPHAIHCTPGAVLWPQRHPSAPMGLQCLDLVLSPPYGPATYTKPSSHCPGI